MLLVAQTKSYSGRRVASTLDHDQPTMQQADGLSANLKKSLAICLRHHLPIAIVFQSERPRRSSRQTYRDGMSLLPLLLFVSFWLVDAAG